MKSAFFQGSRPRLFAHRGFSEKAAENSLEAFQMASEHCPYLETDLWATKDGVLVLHHDGDLRRSCGLDVTISDLNYEDLAKLRIFGTDNKIPTLFEAFEFCPQSFWNIEIKDPRPGVEARVWDAIRESRKEEHVLIAAEKDEIMQRFRALKTPLPTSASHNEMFGILQWILSGTKGPHPIQTQAFQLPVSFQGIRLDSPALIHVAHEHNVEVHYWTINDAQEVRRLLHLGADGIMSDNPEMLRQHATLL